MTTYSFFFVHRMAPKLQPKEPNAKQTVKPKLKCAWSHCPPCTCKACTQTSHDVDRDSPSGAPKYVLWTKTKQVTTGKRVVVVAVGEECGHCFNTRRSDFQLTDDSGAVKVPSMSDLIAARLKDPETEQAFTDARAARCQGQSASLRGKKKRRA